jgi:microtubule-associated protein, RP/EB family
MTESFGMMDNAYFVGKNEILKWVNTTLKLNLSKIEQACTGAVYCQIIDSIHPNKVKMNKVNWKAKLEHEYIPNYKILQLAFIDCQIPKNIEVEKLIKGKYQDNLEFLQWMKRYYEEKQGTTDYDPVARRNNCDLEIANENFQKKRDLSKSQSATSITLKSVKSDKNLLNNASNANVSVNGNKNLTSSSIGLNIKPIKNDLNGNKENVNTDLFVKKLDNVNHMIKENGENTENDISGENDIKNRCKNLKFN